MIRSRGKNIIEYDEQLSGEALRFVSIRGFSFHLQTVKCCSFTLSGFDSFSNCVIQ